MQPRVRNENTVSWKGGPESCEELPWRLGFNPLNPRFGSPMRTRLDPLSLAPYLLQRPLRLGLGVVEDFMKVLYDRFARRFYLEMGGVVGSQSMRVRVDMDQPILAK